MKKRIFAIILALVLMPLLVFGSSAIAFVENDLSDYPIGFQPLLSHKLTFYDAQKEIEIGSPILLDDGSTTVDVRAYGASDDIADVLYYGLDPLVYDFTEAHYGNIDFDPFMVNIDYDPFSIRSDKFVTWEGTYDFVSFPFLDSIGAEYSWGGNFTADVEIVIEVNVPWLYFDNYGYKAFQVDYRDYRFVLNLDNVSSLDVIPQINQIKVFDYGGNLIDIDEFIDQTQSLSENQLVHFNISRYGFEGLWYDIQRVGINIYTDDGYFETFNDNSAYISPNEMNDLTDLNFTTFYRDVELTPILYGIRNASLLADYYNKDLLVYAWEHRNNNSGLPSVPAGSAVGRIVSIFLSGVSSFFSIDFFGLGFTIGNVLGVFVLAIMTVIFLRLFAGG